MSSIDANVCIQYFTTGIEYGFAVGFVSWFASYAFSVMFKIFKHI